MNSPIITNDTNNDPEGHQLVRSCLSPWQTLPFLLSRDLVQAEQILATFRGSPEWPTLVKDLYFWALKGPLSKWQLPGNTDALVGLVNVLDKVQGLDALLDAILDKNIFGPKGVLVLAYCGKEKEIELILEAGSKSNRLEDLLLMTNSLEVGTSNELANINIATAAIVGGHSDLALSILDRIEQTNLVYTGLYSLFTMFGEAAWKGDLKVLARILKTWVPKIERNLDLKLPSGETVGDRVDDYKRFRQASPELAALGITGLLFGGEEPALAKAIAAGREDAVTMLLEFTARNTALKECVNAHMMKYYDTKLNRISLGKTHLGALIKVLEIDLPEGYDPKNYRTWRLASKAISSMIQRNIASLEAIFSGITRIMRAEIESVHERERIQHLRPPPKELPAEFNRDLFERVRSLLSRLDKIETAVGDVDAWARNLTIIFDNYDQVVQYIKRHIELRTTEADKLFHYADAIPCFGTWYPEEAKPSGSLSEKTFTRAFIFELPDSAGVIWSPKKWRALLLDYPLASMALSQAVQFEAYLKEHNLAFPETRKDFEKALLDFTLANLPPKSRVSGAIRHRTGSIVIENKRSLETPFPCVVSLYLDLNEYQKSIFDNLTFLGVLGNSTRARPIVVAGTDAQERREPDSLYLKLAPGTSYTEMDLMFALLDELTKAEEPIYITQFFVEWEELDDDKKLALAKNVVSLSIREWNLPLDEVFCPHSKTPIPTSAKEALERVHSAQSLADLRDNILWEAAIPFKIADDCFGISCCTMVRNRLSESATKAEDMLKSVREADNVIARFLESKKGSGA